MIIHPIEWKAYANAIIKRAEIEDRINHGRYIGVHWDEERDPIFEELRIANELVESTRDRLRACDGL